MNLVDQIFWKYVELIEYLGTLSGLGYELTNLLLFVIIQPILILIFLFLWLKEKKRNKSLVYSNQSVPKSKFIYFFWRLSRFLSLFVLSTEILVIYLIFQLYGVFPIESSIESGLLKYIESKVIMFLAIILPICVILTYNFLIFGKVTIWLKRL